MRLNLMLALIVTTISLASCAERSYVPPELLQPPAGQFTQAVAAFAEDTNKEHLATYRKEVRRDLFVETLVAYVETETPTDDILKALTSAKTPDRFLCLPQYAHKRVSLRLGNIAAVGTALGKPLEKPSDDLGKLFKALGTNYAIKTETKDAPSTYDQWVKEDDGKRCLDTVKDANPFATRSYIGKEFGPAMIPAAISAIEAVWTVLKPVLVGALQNIDLERRNAAVKAYFADTHNVEALKQNLTTTETYLTNEFLLNQRRAAGQAAAAAALLFDATAPHWSSIKVVAMSPNCRRAATRVGGMSSSHRVECIDAAIKAASGAFDRAIETADKFDTALEQHLPKDRLSAQVDTLRKVAIGGATTDDELKALWATSVRYFTLYKTINDATSSANQKTISDAFAEFIKAVK